MPTIRIATDSALPPTRVLYAAYDFGPDRTLVWPAVRAEHLTVHELSHTTADATEGTSPLLPAPRCLTTSRVSLPVHGVSTTRVTTAKLPSTPAGQPGRRSGAPICTRCPAYEISASGRAASLPGP